MSALARYSALQKILASLEEDLGLSELNYIERRIIAVLADPAKKSGGVSVQDLQDLISQKDTSQSTLYRAVRRLKELDYIEVVGNKKTGNYRMTVR